ncbi:MAG: hypothetical protein M1426_05585, partial [Patescibacteria group bacterium]|nr:hypothetical protein [Patescibacteria group bacterium]
MFFFTVSIPAKEPWDQNPLPYNGSAASFLIRTDPLQNISSQVWYEGKSKSMRNAVILTLLVPGAGEMYTGR